MENKSKYPEYAFLNAKAIMEELYPIRMSEDNFLEKAYYAWKELPDKHTHYHVYIGEIGADNKLELPDNVDYILSVTYSYYMYNYYFNNNRGVLMLYRDGSNMLTKTSSEWDHYRLDKSVADRFGENITYDLEDNNTISFPQGELKGMEVAVLYSGIIVDGNCDPKLTYREVRAIAHRVAYYQTRFDAFANVPGAASLLSYTKEESDIAILRAGVPEKITDNQLDGMLNVMVSNDRKVYNKNYKFRH